MLGLYPISAAPTPSADLPAGSCGSWLLLWPSLDSHNLEMRLATQKRSSRASRPCHASEEVKRQVGRYLPRSRDPPGFEAAMAAPHLSQMLCIRLVSLSRDTV